MTTGSSVGEKDQDRRTFFISRAGPDKDRGKMIAGWLEEAGYKTFLQDWDIEPGADFQALIHRSLADGAHVIALLSEHYLRSPWCQMEWNAATKAQVETGKARLMPLRIDACHPPGLLTLAVFIDLVDDAEEAARRKILTAAASIGQVERKGGTWSIPTRADRPRIDNLEAFDPELFAGRQDELSRLHERLDQPTGTSVAVTALSGLGGVGKSALARAYCHEHRADYEVIWWVRSENENDLRHDLAQLAIAWDPANAILGNSEAQAREAIRLASTWSGRRPFLVVFDNVVSPSTLRNFRPTGGCRVVVTSRNTSWGREWRPLTVRKLDPDTGAKLLMRASGRGDYEGARKIAVELDGLALPLSHAAAILRENVATTFDDLLRRYDTFMQLQTDDADVRTTYATYSVALEDLADKNPISRDVMSAAAYCAPEGISAAILEQSFRSRMDNALLASPADTSDRINDALGALARYAMIEVERTEGDLRVSVHRVVQRVVRRHHLDKHERAAWGCATLAALNTKVAEKRADARRHAKEALSIVPADLCPDTYKALTLAVDGDVIVGRERELEMLHTLLSERGARSVLIAGAAGTGKSSLARLYANQHRGEYSDVWFVDGSSRDTARQTLNDAAVAAGLRTAGSSADSRTGEALNFAGGSGKTSSVLIIVDNAETASFLPAWIEATLGAKYIVCSRESHPFAADATIRLASLTIAESIALLRRHGVSVADGEAHELSEFLGFLPLAIMQAANYLSQPGAPNVATYLQQLRSVQEKSRGAGGRAASVNEAIAAQYFALSAEAQALLRALCVCADTEIPYPLISTLGAMATEIGSPERALVALESVVRSRMAVAQGFGLAGSHFTVHPILAETVRRTLPAERLVELANGVLDAVPRLLPTSDAQSDLALAERLVEHAVAAIGFSPDPPPDRVALNLLLSGRLHLKLGDAQRAVKHLERSLHNWEESNQLGAEYAATMIELSSALKQVGRGGEAKEMSNRAVSFAERYYGRNNAGVADALLQRASIDLASGDLDAAEEAARRVASLHTSGSSSPLLAVDALVMTGRILGLRGDTSAAESTLRHALALAQRSADKLRIAAVLSSLAEVERETKQSDAALKHFRDALALRESILGEDHPEIATNLNQLAGVLQTTGQVAAAEPFYRRALAISESISGTNPETIAMGLIGLARNLGAAKRWSEVTSLAQRAIALLEALGFDPSATQKVAEARALLDLASQGLKALAPEPPEARRTVGSILQSIFRSKK